MPTRGKVKWFDPKKGYGFILGPEEQDVFVHFSQIQGDGFRSLKDGEEVDYELIEGDKGWQAKSVLRVLIESAEGTAESAGDISSVLEVRPGDNADAFNQPSGN